MLIAKGKNGLAWLGETISDTFYMSKASLGLALLALLLAYDPRKAALAVFMGALTQYLGVFLRADVALLQSRLLALNGVFLGLSLASFFQVTPGFVLLAAIGSLLLAGFVMVGDRLLKTWDLPLGVSAYGPAFIMCWLLCQSLPWVDKVPLAALPAPESWYLQIFFGSIRSFGQIFFRDELSFGLAVLVLLTIFRWKMAVMAFAAALLASALGSLLQIPSWQVAQGLAAFPAVLVVGAVHSGFRGFTYREALFASIASPILEAASLQWSQQLKVPILAVVYMGIVWLLCLIQPTRGLAAQQLWSKSAPQKWL